MLAAKNADICRRCLVTEPWVRSFISREASLNSSVAQHADITSVCDFSIHNHRHHNPCNSQAVVGGWGIGGGIPAETRFLQATRWRMRKISQLTNATRPPGMVTSMNQPITPSE